MPTLHATCPNCSPLIDGSGPAHHGQTDLRTASTPEPYKTIQEHCQMLALNPDLHKNLSRLHCIVRLHYFAHTLPTALLIRHVQYAQLQ